MHFLLLPQEFSVCKLPDNATIDFSSPFVFAAKTDDELSLVCETSALPRSTQQCKHGWRAMKIAGELDFSLVGILAEVSGILAEQGISIFAISTYNTDYILVQNEQLDNTVDILQKNGHTIGPMEV